jgi:benzoylformate decarboxylase
MSSAHPLYQWSTGLMFGETSRKITSLGDVNLVVGTYMLPEVFPNLDDIFASDAKTIHVDLNAYEIGKNHPVDLGLVSDPKLTLARLAEVLEEMLDAAHRAAAAHRVRELTDARQTALAVELQKDAAVRDAVPLQFSAFMETLARHVPKDVVFFDEALTNSPALTRYCTPTEPGSFFQTRGGSLGLGIPGAIGIKLALPHRAVFGVTGDGGSMYTIQALWSAARHNVDAKFIVCNNRSYRLLQLNIQQYWSQNQTPPHDFPLSFDLSRPDIHFAELSQSLGVPAVRVERTDQIEPAIRQALDHSGPFLIDVVLDGDVQPDMIGPTCGQ